MPSPPPSPSPTPPPVSTPRGVLSCLYSRCEVASHESKDTASKLLFDIILGSYKKAAVRLQDKHQGIDLHPLMSDAGLCVGLLDPVSNIVLNTFSELAASPSSPPPKKSKRTLRKISGNDKWHDIASKSYRGLIEFMQKYFGCLSKDQAIRYLLWAEADITLAAMLVEREFNALVLAPAALDPGSERTQTALKMAALEARHPAPDRLVRLASSRIPQIELEVLADVLLNSDQRLHPTVVNTISDLLCRLDRPVCDVKVTLLPYGREAVFCVRKAGGTFMHEGVTHTRSDLGDDYITTTTRFQRVGEYITSLRPPKNIESMLSVCFLKADVEKHRLSTPCGNNCEYLQSLKMRLLETIQSFYIKVFSMLPADHKHMIRSILVAGHCYGPADPVSNIVLNSIWYDKWCPLPEADRNGIQAYDVLNPLCMLRTQARSLKGLLCLASSCHPEPSVGKCALKSLCDEHCDLSNRIRELVGFTSRSSSPFHMAAEAAEHPLPVGLGLLHEQLAQAPEELGALCSVISANSVLSIDACNRIYALLDRVFIITPPVRKAMHARAPKLFKEALNTLSRKRSAHGCKSEFIRSKLAQLLDNYTSQHLWEPKYVLNFICGVEESGPSFTACYRVNFMATSALQLENTLFFAEFWVSYPELSKPNFCCPLPKPYPGRCYFGGACARKIVYPSTTQYFGKDITAYGTKATGDMLDTDFVYFNSLRDVKFANEVNSYYAPKFPVESRPIVLATDNELKMLGP